MYIKKRLEVDKKMKMKWNKQNPYFNKMERTFREKFRIFSKSLRRIAPIVLYQCNPKCVTLIEYN